MRELEITLRCPGDKCDRVGETSGNLSHTWPKIGLWIIWSSCLAVNEDVQLTLSKHILENLTIDPHGVTLCGLARKYPYHPHRMSFPDDPLPHPLHFLKLALKVYPLSPLEFPKFSHTPYKYCKLLMKTSSFVLLDAKFCEFHVFLLSVKYYNR